MYEAILNGTWKRLFFMVFVCCGILLTVSYYDYAKYVNYRILLTSDLSNISLDKNINKSEEDEQYLVSSSKCKIIDLDPFSKDAKRYFKPMKYKSCSKSELLTYVTKVDNIATVHIDTELIPEYTHKSLSCCYSDVTRSTSATVPDDVVKISKCKDFQDNTTITEEAVLIKCFEHPSKKVLYENVHASVRITKDVQKKMTRFDSSTKKPLSVLFVGIDSISRLNFIRALPNTHKYVESNGWISLKGYNKMEDNTFPNLMAILTGYDLKTAYKICNPRSAGFLDKCPLIWNKFRDFGYITGYAEDAAAISTFNYNKNGFVNRPTDYYFRPYIMATEKLYRVIVSSMGYCTGPETAGERIMNLAKDFSTTFKNYPNFGFFWMNTFSHNEVSTPSMMDNKIKSFLTDLENSGVTNETLIIFLSDHGMRFGDIRLTETGWLEERLPFIYFSFPPWFIQKFPKEYQTFKSNRNKLTTPYDLYLTLQHILVLSEFNYTVNASLACPKCVSLFKEVPVERSCEEAGIEDHWCTCIGYIETKLDIKGEEKVSSFVLGEIHKIISDRKKIGGDRCAKYTVEKISTRVSHRLSYKNTTYILVNVKMFPRAIFETTVSYEGDIKNSVLALGDVSRLDYYNPHSNCVTDAYLKKYCYCR